VTPPPPDIEESEEDAASEAAGDGTLRGKLKDFETRLILEALQATGGSQVRAAGLLGLPVRTLVHKIKTLGIRHAYARES
jgi:two-component system response regulator AtoC